MKLTAKYYAAAWFLALQETPVERWSEVSHRVLQYMYRHGHMKTLPDIIRRVADLEQAVSGTTPVMVRTAHQLPTAMLAALVARILPSQAVKITDVVDGCLLGKVQVQTANQRWDYSIQHQLRILSQRLMNN